MRGPDMPTKALCFFQPPCSLASEQSWPLRGQLILLWNFWVLTSPGLGFTPSHNDGCDSLVTKETVQKSPKLSSTPNVNHQSTSLQSIPGESE